MARLGNMKVAVQVVRRDLVPPAPGSAEPRHAYTPIFLTRAEVKSHSGLSEFAQVTINGRAVTHTFTIRWTAIAFDVRDRLRDARGRLYQILKVDNVNLANKWLKISASDQGLEDLAGAQ